MNRLGLVILTFITLLFFMVSPGNGTGSLLWIFMLFVAIIPVVISWRQRDTAFFIIYIYMLFYAFPPMQYYFEGKHIIYWRTICQSQLTVFKTMLALVVFYIGLMWGQYGKGLNNISSGVYKRMPINNNTLGYCFCVALAVICFMFGKSGETIIESGGYGRGTNVVNTSLYGYGIIPLLVGVLFSDTKVKRNLIFSLCAIYIVKDLIYGGRVDSIQLCIGLYLIYFRFRWSFKKTLAIACAGFAVMSIWGIFRAAVGQGIGYAYDRFINDIGGDSNSNEVFYSSMRIIYMIEQGILGFSERVQALVGFIESVFLPYSWLPDIANLSSWKQHSIGSGGGGLISVFAYAMFGWVGIFIIAYLIGKAFRRFQESKGKPFFTFWAVLVLATAPRWFAYYPIALVKMSLFGSILYVVINRLFPSKKNQQMLQ